MCISSSERLSKLPMVTQLNDSQDSHLGLSDLKVRALNFQATLPPGVTVNLLVYLGQVIAEVSSVSRSLVSP